MSKRQIHIIGAGLAGLSAAVYCPDGGCRINIYEASKYAGGRCRSFYDSSLDCQIDNGNHLILEANKDVIQLINQIGAEDKFYTSQQKIEFYNLRTQESWQLEPQRTFSIFKDIPHSTIKEYLKSLKLLFANRRQTVCDVLRGSGALFDNFWNPISVSMLNTQSEMASAQMLRNIMLYMLLSGRNAMQPYVPKKSWHESLIEPCLNYIENKNGQIEYQQRLQNIVFKDGRAVMLQFNKQQIAIGEHDKVIVAVPAQYLKSIGLENVKVPENYNAIVNVHYKMDKIPEHTVQNHFYGVVGGTAEWFFIKDNIISSTTSAANHLIQKSEDQIVQEIWQDCQKMFNIEMKFSNYRLLIEKKATFSCDVNLEQHRPDNNIGYDNLVIAGDYTNTKLPATIQSAVVSGKKASIL